MKLVGVGLVVLVVVAVIVFIPLASIWALNVLFGTAIAFTFKTWLAALILGGLVGGTAARTASKK